MTTKSKTPQIRFKGFSEEWENAEIGDYADIIAGGTPSTSNPTYWNPKQIPWMSSGEINKKRLFFTDNQISEIGLENSSAKWIKSNCVLIALAGQGKTRGTVAINHIPLTTNQSIAAIVPNEKLYFEFLYQNLENRYDELRTKSSGDGSRGGLNKQIISQISIDFPEITEQTKIGDYFQNLDKLIDEKEQKYQKLRQFKTAMLSKMFPQNGAATPEIRFKGFSGEWEEKKLGELSEYKNGKGHEDKQKTFGKYELINLNSISIDGGLKHSGKFVDETDTTLNRNDLVMVLSDVGHGDLLGRVALIPKDNKFVLNQRVALLRPSSPIFPLFLFYNINANQKYFKLQGAGMSQLNISKSSVENFTSHIPSDLIEQTKIGNYFQKLDKLINLHLQELEKLKNIKKASLEKMFV